MPPQRRAPGRMTPAVRLEGIGRRIATPSVITGARSVELPSIRRVEWTSQARHCPQSPYISLRSGDWASIPVSVAGVTSARPEVLIVGAGVSGLTTGVRLAESGKRVRLVADRRPRDSTSPAAGAIWDPIYATHPRVLDWSRRSYDVLSEMVRDRRPEVQLIDGVEASRVAIPAPRWARRLPAFRECTAAELPAGFATGWRYRAPLVDM